jgi:hypothetical protein
VTPNRRSLWGGLAALAYVCFGALGSATSTALCFAVFGAGAAAMVDVWRRTGRNAPGEHRVEATASSALRACVWGGALWAVARTGAAGRPALDAAANLGAGVASVGALVALARVAPLGGQLGPHPATRSLDAACFAALVWAIAVAVPGTRAFVPSSDLVLDPLAIDYATTTASLGSLLVLIAATWRMRLMRRLEIGVGDRAAGALALALTAFCVGVPAAAADIAAPDRVLPVAVIAGSLACAWTATTAEPTSVSVVLRGTLAVMMLGVPTSLGIAIAARVLPAHASGIALLGCALSIAVGVLARAVARPLGPEQSRWLEAFDAASRGALQPEPDAAIRAALVALRPTATLPGTRPELWRASPPEILSVDVAGYLHVERGEAPARVYEVATKEPERTLRAEVLEALQVRRPDLRPLLAWFVTHEAFSATVVMDEDGPIGLLLLPRGTRRHPMTLEEARAARLLADRISALLAVSSAMARSRDRETAAEQRAQHAEGERARLEQIVTREGDRHAAHAEMLARPVRVGLYSPAARLAQDEIERRGRSGDPLALCAPAGVDAIGWAALAHLASARRGGPFVVVRGTSGGEHDPARWTDPVSSPVEVADGGTLFVQDVQALPLEVQEALARSLTRKAMHSPDGAVPATGLCVSFREPLESMVAARRVSRALASLLGERVIDLPTLADRSEDLRALILEHLAAAGTRRRGQPLGVDARALEILLEHTWPGNDGELADLLTRASEGARGPVVTPADLATVGFSPLGSLPASHTPLPVASRRRPRPRGASRRH